jgi:virginiamycin A acetyltransferase
MTTWLTTYPFPIFGNGWDLAEPPQWPHRGDTRVGNDVCVGYRATIMPGVTIGDGAIVATVERLRAIAWWDWDAAKVARNVRLICAGDVEALERAA